jgi:hypothetical protein
VVWVVAHGTATCMHFAASTNATTESLISLGHYHSDFVPSSATSIFASELKFEQFRVMVASENVHS